VRGGGEYGRAWHEAATGTRRRKAFEDFIAAARWLADTTGVKPVARGNSNGGLLVAASLLLDPDAFAGVFCRAALLDMLGFTRFPNSATATVEYGSPDDPEERAYLRGYSPLHNVAPRRYPPVALVSALNDRTAPPYDPLKLAAELQDRASGGPFLVLPLRDSGHGGGTTVSARIDQDADELRFLCLALDLAVVTNEPSREPPSAEATRQSQSARGSASEGGL
jgi:prolyl oligopeptidase